MTEILYFAGRRARSSAGERPLHTREQGFQDKPVRPLDCLSEQAKENACSGVAAGGLPDVPGLVSAETRQRFERLSHADRLEALRLSVEEGLGVDEAIEEVLRRFSGEDGFSVHVRWLDRRPRLQLVTSCYGGDTAA